MNIPVASPQTPKVNAADIALERLSGNSQLSETDKTREATRQFEALLIRQILQAAQKSGIKSSFNEESSVKDIYNDMIHERMADAVSRSGGLGLSESLTQQLTRPGAGSKPEGTVSSAREIHSNEN